MFRAALFIKQSILLYFFIIFLIVFFTSFNFVISVLKKSYLFDLSLFNLLSIIIGIPLLSEIILAILLPKKPEPPVTMTTFFLSLS